jgi:hypothetical protein
VIVAIVGLGEGEGDADAPACGVPVAIGVGAGSAPATGTVFTELLPQPANSATNRRKKPRRNGIEHTFTASA